MNNFIFFGSDDFSIDVLKVLLENNIKPKFVITQPDRPKGRNLILTPPEIKTFCLEKHIKVLQFEALSKKEILNQVKDDVVQDFRKDEITPSCHSEFNSESPFDYFVVASYGKIIPKEIVKMPKLGVLNVHPSLLPKYRGASPLETAILNDDKKTGVTIMMMDEKMDHGPIVEQKVVVFDNWPSKIEMRDKLAKIGGEMLVEIIPHLENIKTTEQDHEKATFTKLIKKEDGEISLESIEHKSQRTEYREQSIERKNYLKYLAYTPWPGTFFFVEKNNKKIRVKITEATFENEIFTIKKVIPEGKSEMTFESFRNGYLGRK